MKKQGARVDEQLFYVSLVYTGALVYLGALSTPAIYKKVVLVYPGLVSSKRRWGRRSVGVDKLEKGSPCLPRRRGRRPPAAGACRGR